MTTSLRRLPLLLVALFVFSFSLPALAQDGGQDERQDWRERWQNATEEEREQMREEFRQRMAERRAEQQRQQAQQMRERLGMSEEDFEAVSPLIESVRSAIRERDLVSRFGRQQGRQGRQQQGRQQQGRGQQQGAAELSAEAQSVREAMAELRQAIEDDNSGAIKTALKDLREGRAAMDKKVADAREELRSVCTAKWEAEFVVMGVLD